MDIEDKINKIYDIVFNMSQTLAKYNERVDNINKQGCEGHKENINDLSKNLDTHRNLWFHKNISILVIAIPASIAVISSLIKLIEIIKENFK